LAKFLKVKLTSYDSYLKQLLVANMILKC